jgi:molybdopterin-containing oxidoreductase family iron-sulfur binding subunit
MNADRRELIKKSLFILGSATTGAAAAKAFGSAAAASAPAGEAPMVPAMTPDGRIVHVHASAAPKSATAVRQGIPGRKWVMVFDLAGCDGCKNCTRACGQMHAIPGDREWIRVFKMQDSPDTAPYYFPRPCFHCDNPPCTRVCPVDATFKRQDGTVLIDNERCIGCRFCMAACPYSVRVFNWDRPHDPPEILAQPYSPEHGTPRRIGTVEKCDFCPDMAEEGKLPACAAACPMGVIYYGDQNEDAVTNSKGETVRLSTLLTERAGYRYMEELGTEPRVYYLPQKNRLYAPPDRPGAIRGHDPMHHQ